MRIIGANPSPFVGLGHYVLGARLEPFAAVYTDDGRAGGLGGSRMGVRWPGSNSEILSVVGRSKGSIAHPGMPGL